jgi:hypothetical protein
MRPVFVLVAVLVATSCGGDEQVQAMETSSGGLSFVIENVHVGQTEVWAEDWPPGPPSGWATAGGVQFFVRTPKQTVDQPARLTFTIDADLFDDVTRDRVDQLGVFMPGGSVLPPSAESSCDGPDGRAEPDPCIAAREFLKNGDGRIVVLASDPATG